MILRAKFYVVSSLLRVFDARVPVYLHYIDNELARKRNYGDLKSASFIVIMFLREGLTHIQIINKALVAFWREFHFNKLLYNHILISGVKSEML